MTKMMIEKGIVIDDVACALSDIGSYVGRRLTDFSVVKKFITTEKNTKFYIDRNLNSSMQCGADCVYVWLDTGYRNRKEYPIMISLRKVGGEFVGHKVGLIRDLAESARQYYSVRSNVANQKVTSFEKKYVTKTKERENVVIGDEKAYLLGCCNQGAEITEITEFASKLMGLQIEFAPDVEEIIPCEEVVEEISSFTDFEEEITIGLLMEKMDGMQEYIDELLAVIDSLTKEKDCMEQESALKIQELQDKSDEYKRVIHMMRGFVEHEEELRGHGDYEEDKIGHALLGKRGKILVVGGTELGKNIMTGIGKTYGFEKNDFEFIGYEDAKSFMDRVRKDGRYPAMIVGPCPHMTRGTAGYSSIIEKLRKIEGMPYLVDARSKSGALKMTKESFKMALLEVIKNMMDGKHQAA